MSQRLPRFHAEVERIQDAERLGRILLEVDDTQLVPRPVNGAGGGESRRLRGLPVVGVPGTTGASPGTDPVRALLAKEGQRRRR